MATFDEEALDKRWMEVKKRDPEYIQFDEEYQRHQNEWSRLIGEVKQLEKQKNEAKDEEGRKVIEKKIAIKSLEKDLANSKRIKALYQQNQRSWELRRDMLLQEMKTSTSDVMKNEIQRRLEEAEGMIRTWKEEANKYESEANSREERLLTKEGGVRAVSESGEETDRKKLKVMNKFGFRAVKRKIESREETELKVMNKFGLERDDLKFRCPSRVLNSIAGEMIDDWPMIGQALDVSSEELKSISQDPSHSSPKQKAATMLDAWAEEKGREATCLKLAEALHKCKKISTLEKFCKEVKPEVKKRRDMTTLPAQLERDLLLKEQKTTTSDRRSLIQWPKSPPLPQQTALRLYGEDTTSYPTYSSPTMFYSNDSDRGEHILSDQQSVSSGYSSGSVIPYFISATGQLSEKFKVLEGVSEATKLAFAVGDMHVSPSKVAKTEMEPTTKPYKKEQIKQEVIKSSPIEDPGCQLAKEMITGVPGSDSKETDSDRKEASSKQPPKEKASSSLSAAETCVSSYALQQSTFFEEARIKAKIPFLYHQVLECDSSGGEFNIVKHDITVEIPKGCVSEGEKLCLEVGVAMYGPFKFTDDSQPISPILWLCFLNKDVKVNKPIKITVPHFLTGLIESRLLQHRVSFAKANHLNHSPQEDFIMYNFEPSKDKTQFISRKDKSYGVLETTHCCFYCIKAKKTPRMAKDAGYCLTRVERLTSRGSEIHFAATYFLDTCCEALEEQCIADGYRIVSCKRFKFKECEAEALKITVPENEDKYLVTKDPHSTKILASEIDFWSKQLHDVLLENRLRIYPPRVKMEVILKTSDHLIIVMKFSGSQDDQQLDVKLALTPQNTATSLDQPASTLTQQHTTNGDFKAEKRIKSGAINDPDLLFKVMSEDIGDKYMEVGIYLGMTYKMLRNELETVRLNMFSVNRKAMRMLQIWKASVAEEDLTYSKLAAALEKNGLIRCADKYCYTTATASEQ